MRYAVDIIAKYTHLLASQNEEHLERHANKYIVIWRLSYPVGLAFPGGGIELGEDKVMAAVREYNEETNFMIIDPHQSLTWLDRIYDKPGRDPRGPVTSYVAYGDIHSGTPKNEPGKTEVLFLSKEEILTRGREFVFDHFQMFLDYLEESKVK